MEQQLNISNNTYMEVYDGEKRFTKEFRVLDLANFIGGAGLTPVEINSGDFSTATLQPNTLYIVDNGDTRYLPVSEEDERIYCYTDQFGILNPNMYRTMRIVNFGYEGIESVYSETIGAISSKYYIWGGLVWKAQTTGNIPPSNDIELPSADFEVVQKADNDFYVLKTFKCNYDRRNRWVSYQEDEFNNRVGLGSQFSFMPNPCDLTDWGYPLMVNNSVSGGVFNNNVVSELVGNQAGVIKNLTCNKIYNNVSSNGLVGGVANSDPTIDVANQFGNEYRFDIDFNSKPLVAGSSLNIGTYFGGGLVNMFSVTCIAANLTDGGIDDTALRVTCPEGTLAQGTLLEFNSNVAAYGFNPPNLVGGYGLVSVENLSLTQDIISGVLTIYLKIYS